MKLESAMEALRLLLLDLPASGQNSFEDLVARALEDITGYGFRVMPTGRQDGGDAVGHVGDDLVVVEAKRYDKPQGLRQSLLVKIQEVASGRRGKPDLWVAAITTQLAGDDKQEVEAAAERVDVPVVIADWTGNLPDLAVLIAAGRRSTLPFLNRTKTKGGRSASALLDAVESHQDFQKRRNRLVEEISFQALAFQTFFDDARSTNEAAMQDRQLARRRFGQFLTPLQPHDGVPGKAVLERGDLLDELERKVDAALINGGPVVVLGEEGVGKSWVVADWWARRRRQNEAFIFISAASVSNRSQQLDAILSQGMFDLLNRSRQTSRQATERWQRRLSSDGFKRQAKGRLILVVDGLNEEPWIDWGARVLPALIASCSEYGAKLIITCRPVYWQRQVAHDLDRSRRSTMPVVRVEGFSSDERDEYFRLRGLSKDALSPRLLAETKNPRALSLAIELVNTSSHQGIPGPEAQGGLGLDVLLLNYWDHRRTERSEFIRPDNRDFIASLRRTAKPIWEHLKQIGTGHETHSTSPLHRVIMKEWVSSLARESSDIARLIGELSEGMFFQEPAGRWDEGSALREKTHAFCVGLYLYGFLREKGQELTNVQQLRDWLDSEIDPVRDFDRTSEHLLAALTAACFDDDPDDIPAIILADALLRLRNRPADLFPEFAYLLRERSRAFCSARQWLLDISPAESRADWISMGIQQALRRSSDEINHLIEPISNWITGSPTSIGWPETRPVFLLDSRPLESSDLVKLALFIIGHNDILPFVQAFRSHASSMFAVNKPLDASVRDRLLLDLSGGAFERALLLEVGTGGNRSEHQMGGDNMLLAALGTPTAVLAIDGTIPSWVIDMGTLPKTRPVPSSRTIAAFEIDQREESDFRDALLRWSSGMEPQDFRSKIVSSLSEAKGAVLATRLVLIAELAPTLLASLDHPKVVSLALEIAVKALQEQTDKQDVRYAVLLACALHACFMQTGKDDQAFASLLVSNSLTSAYAYVVETVGSASCWQAPLRGDAFLSLLMASIALPPETRTAPSDTTSVVSKLLKHRQVNMTDALEQFLVETAEDLETPGQVIEPILRFAIESESVTLARKLVALDGLPRRHQNLTISSYLGRLKVCADVGREPLEEVLRTIDRSDLPFLLGLVDENDALPVVEALIVAVNTTLSEAQDDSDLSGTVVEMQRATATASRRIWRLARDQAETWFEAKKSEKQSKALDGFLDSLFPFLDRPRKGCDRHLQVGWKRMRERGSTFPKIGLSAKSSMYAIDLDDRNAVVRLDAIILGLGRNDAAHDGLVDLILESPLRRQYARNWIDAASRSTDCYRLSHAITLAASLDHSPPQLKSSTAILDMALEEADRIKQRGGSLKRWEEYAETLDRIKRAMVEISIFSTGVVRVPDIAGLSEADRAILETVARKGRNDADLKNAQRFFGYREPPPEWLFPDVSDLMPGQRLAGRWSPEPHPQMSV